MPCRIAYVMISGGFVMTPERDHQTDDQAGNGRADNRDADDAAGAQEDPGQRGRRHDHHDQTEGTGDHVVERHRAARLADTHDRRLTIPAVAGRAVRHRRRALILRSRIPARAGARAIARTTLGRRRLVQVTEHRI